MYGALRGKRVGKRQQRRNSCVHRRSVCLTVHRGAIQQQQRLLCHRQTQFPQHQRIRLGRKLPVDLADGVAGGIFTDGKSLAGIEARTGGGPLFSLCGDCLAVSKGDPYGKKLRENKGVRRPAEGRRKPAQPEQVPHGSLAKCPLRHAAVGGRPLKGGWSGNGDRAFKAFPGQMVMRT